MSVRPIIMQPVSVRGILDGRKIMTRRVILRLDRFGPVTEFGPSDTPGYDWHFRDKGMRWHDLRHDALLAVLPYAAGDLLWCREAWRCNGWATDLATLFYRASEGDGYTAMCEQIPVAGKAPLRVTGTWRPSIHMRRWASRLTLRVSAVKVERLQDISEEDARAEGAYRCENGWSYGGSPLAGSTARGAFYCLWNNLHGPDAWSANPWVAAISFSAIRENVDRVLEREAA